MKIKKEIYAYTGEKRILRAFEKTMYRDVTRGQFVYDTWTYAHDSSVPYEIVTREEILEDWKPKEGELVRYIYIDYANTPPIEILRCSFYPDNIYHKNAMAMGLMFPDKSNELAEAKLSEIKTLLK